MRAVGEQLRASGANCAEYFQLCTVNSVTPASRAARADGAAVGQRGGERLLAEDVAAGARGGDDERRVQRRRRGDVDEVEPLAPRAAARGIVVEARVRAAALPPAARRAGSGSATATMREVVARQPGRQVPVLGDVAEAEDAPCGAALMRDSGRSRAISANTSSRIATPSRASRLGQHRAAD